MSSLTPGMDAALAADRALILLLVKVELPGRTMRLIHGAGSVQWGSEVFSDTDDTFGTLAAVDVIEDGFGDQAPVWSFTMFPPTNAAAAELCSPTYQEAPVYAWLAAISPTTGQLIPDPDLLFYGLLDVPTLNVDRSEREVDISAVSAFDRLLEDDEGARLSDSFHKSIWPGETGFANVTGLTETRYWGLATPRAGGPNYGAPRPNPDSQYIYQQ